MKLALIGATGMVGNVMLKVLEERNFPYKELVLAASKHSVGKTLYCKGKAYRCVSVKEAIAAKPNIALFSAGGGTSIEYAPLFTKNKCIVIDNSSAFRMNEKVPLLVPEINMTDYNKSQLLIANPNCSTIQMVVALAKLHKTYKIKRLVVSTYQSVTGTGVKAVQQLFDEREGKKANKAYPYPIDLNCLPHGGDFEESGYTTEETKLINETRKIFNAPDIQVTATVVRVPVVGGHSISVNAQFKENINMKAVWEILKNTPGTILKDDVKNNVYPMPIYVEHKDDVFIGRVREDFSTRNAINLWIVADNLRKGAATNAIQIAEALL